MKCKKHPKYKAIKYPWSECPDCLEIWKEKQNQIRLDFSCDARAYAEYFASGGSDLGGRARG